MSRFTRDFSLAVSKTPYTVKGRILELLGLIIRYHGETINDSKIQMVQRWCFATLQEQLFTARSADHTLVQGAIGGLDSMLYSSKVEIKPGKIL